MAELEGALARAHTRGREAERLVSDIKINYSALLAQRNQLVDRLAASQLHREKYHAKKEEIKLRDGSLDGFRNDLESMPTDSYGEFRDKLDELKSVKHRLASAAYDHLIPLSVICKTDADGRFRFECPLDQDYVVFTRGRRQTLSGNGEEYEWFVSARASLDEKRQVLLTNNNVIDGPAADNLMQDISGPINYILEDVPSSQSRHLPDRKPLPADPNWAPAGYYFLISYCSVPTSVGVTGVPPGSHVKALKHDDHKYVVQSQDLVFEVPLTQLTDNADIARKLREADVGAQTQIALWQDAEREVEMQNKEVETRAYDEAHRRIEENYKRLHTLTGESRLNEPARP